MPCTITDKLRRPQHDSPTAQVKPVRVNKIAWYEIARVWSHYSGQRRLSNTLHCWNPTRVWSILETQSDLWCDLDMRMELAGSFNYELCMGLNLRVFYICIYIHTAKSTAMYLSNDVTAFVYCSQPPLAQRLTRHDFKAAPPKLSTHSLVKYLPLHFTVYAIIIWWTIKRKGFQGVPIVHRLLLCMVVWYLSSTLPLFTPRAMKSLPAVVAPPTHSRRPLDLFVLKDKENSSRFSTALEKENLWTSM